MEKQSLLLFKIISWIVRIFDSKVCCRLYLSLC